jgi:hypothetical protein
LEPVSESEEEAEDGQQQNREKGAVKQRRMRSCSGGRRLRQGHVRMVMLGTRATRKGTIRTG